MAFVAHRVPIVTDADGVDQSTVSLGPGIIRLLRLNLGTLSTPDIEITEQDNDKQILSVAGVAADADWTPTLVAQDNEGAEVVGAVLPFAVAGRIVIAVSGGGNAKTGELTIVFER